MIKLAQIGHASPPVLGVVFAFLSALFYGLYPATARALYIEGGDAILLALCMTWVRGLSMSLFCSANGLPLFQTREDRKQALIGGFLQAGSTLSIVLALSYIPGPVAMIILFSHTILLLFFMAWRGEIKLNALNISTTIIALIGLSFVLDVWRSQPGVHWLGMGLAFVTALIAVGRLYVYGQQTETRSPIVVGAESFLVAAVLTLAVLFFQPLRLPSSLAGYAYLIVTCATVALGTFCMFFSIAVLGAFQFSLMSKMEPIFTAAFCALLVNEVLETPQYAGMVLVLGSLVFYQLLCRDQKFQKKESSVPPLE